MISMDDETKRRYEKALEVIWTVVFWTFAAIYCFTKFF